jgi:hypothetical protein
MPRGSRGAGAVLTGSGGGGGTEVKPAKDPRTRGSPEQSRWLWPAATAVTPSYTGACVLGNGRCVWPLRVGAVDGHATAVSLLKPPLK